jgi:protocatechuate 3,4-dioxygenase beta subunit
MLPAVSNNFFKKTIIMQRRTFIKETALCAVAVSAVGYIRFNGKNFEGDCETTTDILGPFYRPGAPVRSDLRIKNTAGQLVVLSGQIKHKDCKTPLKNACVEIWHCDGSGVYDNDSPDFKYRAKTYCDEAGNYSFSTIVPVPYDVGNGTIRPAHFHMMISATGYQNLITQLYFTGDKHIAGDGSASLPAAKRRILDIKNGANGEKAVSFNVTMMEKLPADAAVIDRLVGSYTRAEDNKKKEELFKRDGMLWIKAESSINGGYPLEYSGNNIFEYYGLQTKYQFSIQKDGSVKLSYSGTNWNKIKSSWEAVKVK